MIKNYIILFFVVVLIIAGIFGFIQYNSLTNTNTELRSELNSLVDSVQTQNGTIIKTASRLQRLQSKNKDLQKNILNLNKKIESQANYLAVYKDSLNSVPTYDTVYVEQGDSIQSRYFSIDLDYSTHSGVFSLEPPYTLLEFSYSVWDEVEVNFIRNSYQDYQASIQGKNPNAEYKNINFGRVIDNRTFFEKVRFLTGVGMGKKFHPILSLGVSYDSLPISYGFQVIGTTYGSGYVGGVVFGHF